VKSAIVRLGIVAVARALPTSECRATVLRYHSVSASGDYRSPTIAVSAEDFESQMSFLARHYIVFTLDELLQRLEKSDLPRNSVAITFDDGYLDNATEALPILVRYGLPATFFVTSDAVLGKGAFWVGWLYRAVAMAREVTLANAIAAMGLANVAPSSRDAVFAALATLVDNSDGSLRRQRLRDLEKLFPAMPPLAEPSDFMMGLSHLRALRDAGMTIGAHTATHRVLANTCEEEAYEELHRGKIELEAALETSVDHLAYPNGHVVENVDAAASQLAEKIGFHSAGTSRRGVVSSVSQRFNLPRQGVNAALGFSGFVFKLEEARFPFLLRM
jgi:peptidoglycan/xylan/chitin deacetylase (PgdA/CDA1 family)